MTPAQKQAASSTRLPRTLGIGFSGHRQLPDEQKSRQAMREFLVQKRDAGPVELYGVSSSAAGGDLLFAETCLELGIPLRVLLPFPAADFRADFDPAAWQRAERVLGKAASVQVVARSDSREDCYYECGIETVLRSKLLLALWDGEPARGKAGTQEIVSFAQKIGRPVVWIHSVTAELRDLSEAETANLLRDPELEFLNALPDRGSAASGLPGDLARSWFRKVDANASRFAPQARGLASLPILYTAAAALGSEAALWAHGAEAWLAVSVGLGILAALLPAALRVGQRHDLWIRSRTAAEICRSVLALWHAPGFSGALDPEVIPSLSGVLDSLNFLKLIDRERRVYEIEEFKANYRAERLQEQIAYFGKHARRARRQAEIYRITAGICVAVAILAAAWLFGANRLSPAHMVHGRGRERLALFVSVLFQIATVAGALVAVHDCERRQRRYAELREHLEKWDAQIHALRTWPSILRVIGRIEKALALELLEWRALLQSRKNSGR